MIGGALLLFVLNDAFGPGGGQAASNSIGTVGGEDIDYQAFETEVRARIDAYTSAGGQTSTQFEDYIRNQVWTNWTEDMVLGNQLVAMGFNVPKAEFRDMLTGDNPASEMRQQFTDQTTQIYDADSAGRTAAFQENKYPIYWQWQRHDMERTRRYEKFYNLVGKAMYETNLELDDRYHQANDVANFNFVMKKYEDIPDSLVTYNDADLQAYYDEHKDEGLFEQKASRDLRYLEFMIYPSDADKEAVKAKLAETVTDFAEAKDDSAYIMLYSDQKNFAEYEYTIGESTIDIDSAIIKADSGAVVGPFLVQGAFMRLAKVIEPVVDTVNTDTMVKARHILLDCADGDTAAAITKLEGIRTQIEGGASFADMAREHSTGPTGPNGGDLGWFGRGRMVGPFDQAAFEGSVGDMPIVTTQFGAHLIVIENKGIPQKYKILAVDKLVRPSEETIENVYEVADEYVANYFSADSLIAACEAEGRRVKSADGIVKEQAQLPNMQESERVLSWLYDPKTEENDMSDVIELTDRLIIAAFYKNHEDGVQPFEEVKEAVKGMVVQEKKGEMYASLMGGANLEEIATNIGAEVSPANNMKFNQYAIPGGAGNEPEVIGQVFSLQPGMMSIPLTGDYGVYVFMMLNNTPAEPQPNELVEMRTSYAGNNISNARVNVIAALLEVADVQDNRPR